MSNQDKVPVDPEILKERQSSGDLLFAILCSALFVGLAAFLFGEKIYGAIF